MRNFIVLVIATIMVVSMTLDKPPEAPQQAKVAQVSKDISKEPAKAVVEAPVQPQPVHESTCASEILNYDWPQGTAHAVMMVESGNDSQSLNDTPETSDYSVGCFQINLYGSLAKGRPTEEWLKDPKNNVMYAYRMYVGQGRDFCKTSGWYNTCKKLGL